MDEEQEEISFSDIYSAILLDGTYTVEIPIEAVEQAKTGVKNCKAYSNRLARNKGIPIDDSIIYSEVSEPDEEGFVQLTWTCQKKGTLRIKKKQSFEPIMDE